MRTLKHNDFYAKSWRQHVKLDRIGIENQELKRNAVSTYISKILSFVGNPVVRNRLQFPPSLDPLF